MILSKAASWVLALLGCFCFYCNLAFAQETSPNILTQSPSGWDGQFTVSSANGGDGSWAGTSGGSTPNIGASTGTIRFGYGQQTLTQSIAVQQALAQQGIIVEGYTYRWTVKNANANSTATNQMCCQDPLYVEVAIYNTNNQLVEYKKFDYSYRISSWTPMSGTEMFKNPYEAMDLSNLELSVTGKDAGFWAGYWGPEFRDYSVQFLYSIDACISDPLSSTECPGYAEAYFAQQCQANPLYDMQCPGYAQAYFAQQCGLDALYDSACPGYEQAYAIQLNEMLQEEATSEIVDDGTSVDYTEPVVEIAQEDTSSMDSAAEELNQIIESTTTQIIESTAPVIEEQTQNVEFVTQQIESTQPTIEQETTIVEESVAVLEEVASPVEETAQKVEETPKEEVAQESAEAEASQDISSMSNSQIISKLNSLGVLGNEATNGTGDPTGLGRNTLDGVNETSGGTIAGAASGTTSGTTGTSDSSQSGDMSSDSQGTGSSMSISGMPMDSSQQLSGSFDASSPGGATQVEVFQPETIDVATIEPTLQESAGPSFGQAESSIQEQETSGGMGSIPGGESEFSAPGEVSFKMAVGDSVFLVTLDTESQNPTQTGGDPQKDLNSIFGGPESLEDNAQMSSITEQQEETYKTAASRMIEDKIKNISVMTVQQTQKTDTTEEENFVNSTLEESEDDSAGALLTKEVSQADVVAQIAANDEFAEYGNKQLSQIDFYSPKVVYEDKLPENQRGLRNGLAQQLLHEKMVQQQYEK
jgi:hypothetical protein